MYQWINSEIIYKSNICEKTTFFLHQPLPPYSLDIAPCDFCLSPKLRGCRFETIEKMKEALTKVIDTLNQEDFHGAFQNRWMVQQVHCSRRGLLRRGLEFHVCAINKSAHTKKCLETYCMLYRRNYQKQSLYSYTFFLVFQTICAFIFQKSVSMTFFTDRCTWYILRAPNLWEESRFYR